MRSKRRRLLSTKENILVIAPKLTLLAMLAIAATALAAPSAFAQVEPENHNQTPRLIAQAEVHAGAADTNCPNVVPTPPPLLSPTVTSGGCRMHYTAPNLVWSAHLSAGGTEVVVSTCDIEFDVRLDVAGEGWISHHEFTQGPQGTCTRQACGQPTPPTGEGRAWTIYLQETEVAGQGPREELIILLCTSDLSNPANISHCEVTIPITQPTTHRYRWTANDVSGHGTAFPHCEWTGTFDREAVLQNTGEAQLEQSVEIRHN